MKVEITVVNKTDNCIVFEDIQDWDNGLCDTPSDVYRAAIKEYGRCISKMYIDDKNNEAQHIGWVFEKKCYYEDTKEPYIQRTWIVPLLSIETKVIREYAIK